ncbi:hypothetical protein MN116_007725 [Schistosoma mekongi]|uniref:C2H2-type domain-containing protein n=1 Tax=Schistosoma mekongi TaxID=38744 RepID=A0AAE1Z742_SCHME|nr:hypothetical protein MN116_007725 [Schistosoma mekongi]
MTVDYLSCGTCFVTFRLSDISLFIEHKKSSCYSKSSFTPISENDKYASSLSSSTSSASTLETPLLSMSSPFPLTSTSESDNIDTGILKCAQCFRQFTTPWPFLMHVQIEHQLIFINCIEKFSKKYDEQFKGNVDEIMNDNDQCDNNVLHTIDKLLSEKVSDCGLTSDSTAATCANNNSNNNNKSTTTTPSITGDIIVCTYNNDNPNASTQTHLTGIKQPIIPHRKRKYANCCINNESNITCSKLNSINCSNVKDCNLAPVSCCKNLSSDMCPYNNGNSINSNMFISDYCCTTGSVLCKPTSCTNLLNTSEILTQDTSNCASTAVVSCCMRKLICCTSTPGLLSSSSTLSPVCCSGNLSTKNDNHNVIVQEITNTPRNTCCPCSPKKPVTSHSSEVQTDFDPEFSYSDYADLAMLLSEASPTPMITTPPASVLTPKLPQPLSLDIQQKRQNDVDDDICCQTPELHLKHGILKCPNDVIHSCDIDDNEDDNNNNEGMHLSSQIDANATNNSNDSIVLNNLLSNIDIDLPFESLPSSNKTILITPIKADKAVTSTAHNPTNEQLSSVIHTNFIHSDNKSNNSVNDTRDKCYTDSIPRRYMCRECGISFRQNVHLRKHVMVQHTKVKPYHCPYCEYTTVEKSHLTVHIRVHTGERPFSCRECSYSSAQNCTLKSHYLRKHPTNLIRCDYCTELFFTELELSKHHRVCRVAVHQ